MLLNGILSTWTRFSRPYSGYKISFGTWVELLLAYNDDIKRSIKDTSDFAFSDNGPISEGQVMNQHAQVQVNRLVLGKFRALCTKSAWTGEAPRRERTLFHVALLSGLGDLVSVHVELDIVRVG